MRSHHENLLRPDREQFRGFQIGLGRGLVVHRPAPAAQLRGDARTAVSTLVGGVDPGDLARQPLLFPRPLFAGRRGGEPLVEPGTADPEDTAQPGDAVGVAVSGDEPVAAGQRSISCAK